MICDGSPGNIHNGGWLRFDGSRLPEERGTCFVALGRPHLAETALTEALTATSTRRHAGILADLAVVEAQRRDLDQVVAHADTTLAHAQDSGSAMIIPDSGVASSPHQAHRPGAARAADWDLDPRPLRPAREQRVKSPVVV